MLSDKEIKAQFISKCSKEPEKHYPIEALKSLGYKRNICKACGKFFWSIKKEQLCGEAKCIGGYKFIGASPAKYKLDYIEAWKRFAKIFSDLGYTPIKRYPCVSRWNPTTDFTIASIAAFQPWVVSGEAEPPANLLVIPQFCLRFNDIDNVGITGAHYTGFIMWGQHAFLPPEKYNINDYFLDINEWLSKGLGLANEEVKWHEDAWAGGGNFGPSMEFYSRGLELGNQVYMQYEMLPSGARELKIKVCDMGAGHERVPWFTFGTATSYETTFPTVMRRLYEITGSKYDEKIWNRFLPYAGMLNLEEVEDVEKTWQEIASKIEVEISELKEKILPVAALYAIAEHTRTLLFAITDGALPSNVGGMYNLRVIFRRAISLAEKYGFAIDLNEIAELQAKFLQPLFPELLEHLEAVKKILSFELNKYKATKEKISHILPQILVKELKVKDWIELYDSQGITPELIKEEALKLGKALETPPNFYALVAEKHATEIPKLIEEAKSPILELKDLPATEALYFQDYRKTEFDAKVLKILNNYVVLDRTLFYPTGGGQVNDTGKLNGSKVIDVFKSGNIIVHVLESKPKFSVGDKVHGSVDSARRIQLSQHHTVTHIVNAAARKILGRHIFQAGAKKEVDKAYIDLTHYQNLTEEELKKIEEEANKIVNSGIKTNMSFLPRREAELKYGHEIYQGGAVPGKLIRIVEIPGIDVEACGGTHLLNTLEAGKIKLLKSAKVKDGVIRITFVAGAAAKHFEEQEIAILEELSKLLNVSIKQVPFRAKELLEKWKLARKAFRKGQKLKKEELELVSKEEAEVDLLNLTAKFLNTQKEHVLNVVKRLMREFDEFKAKVI